MNQKYRPKNICINEKKEELRSDIIKLDHDLGVELFYDKNTDKIYFKNRFGKIEPLLTNTKKEKNEQVEKTKEKNEEIDIFSFKQIWQEGIIYKKNNCVIDPEDNNYYIARVEPRENILPSDNLDEWDIFIIDKQFSPEIIICGYYTKQKELIFHNSMATIRFDKTGDYNDSYFNFDINYGSLGIREQGTYKFTYSIAYYGSVTTIISMVSTNIINDYIQQSFNKLYNMTPTLNNQPIDDIEDIDEIINYVNHTFMYEANQNDSSEEEIQINFNLCIKLIKNDLNKTINIVPNRTWINIEKIC